MKNRLRQFAFIFSLFLLVLGGFLYSTRSNIGGYFSSRITRDAPFYFASQNRPVCGGPFASQQGPECDDVTSTPAVPQLPAPVAGEHYMAWCMGQSLCVGFNASPALNTVQVGGNTRASSTSFLALVETTIEGPISGMLNTLSTLAGAARSWIGKMGGCSSCSYDDIRLGSGQFASNLSQLQSSFLNTSTLQVVGFALMHGENDEVENTTSTYAANIAQLRTDWEAYVVSTTGQTLPVPMFIAYQQASQVELVANSRYRDCSICDQQRMAVASNTNRIFLVGPGYQYTYQSAGQDVHMTNTSSRLMGEMTGKAMKAVLIDGISWKPLEPTSIAVVSNTITITYHNPSSTSQLVWDETLVLERENPHRGFELYDPDPIDAPTIVTTTISGSTVVITLTKPPRTGSRIRYAYTGRDGIGATLATSPGGNLRNTDATVGQSGTPLYDWAITINDALTNTVATATPDGTATGLRPWDFAVDGADCQTGPAWNPISPYIAVSNTYFISSSSLANTYTCNGASTGMLSAGLGASRFNKGIVMDGTAGWADRTDPNWWTVADGEDMLIRLIWNSASTTNNKYFFAWNRNAGEFYTLRLNGTTLTFAVRENSTTTLTRTQTGFTTGTNWFVDVHYRAANPTNPSVDFYRNGSVNTGAEHTANFGAFEHIPGVQMSVFALNDYSQRFDGTVHWMSFGKGTTMSWFNSSTHLADCQAVGICP